MMLRPLAVQKAAISLRNFSIIIDTKGDFWKRFHIALTLRFTLG
jgi:hypothetical protein